MLSSQGNLSSLKGQKTLWVKEKLLVTMFSKGLFPRGIKRCYRVGMGLPFILT